MSDIPVTTQQEFLLAIGNGNTISMMNDITCSSGTTIGNTPVIIQQSNFLFDFHVGLG
jgi:hypothetical protein